MAIIVDVETQPNRERPADGPETEFGLSYPAPITHIALLDTSTGKAEVHMRPFEGSLFDRLRAWYETETIVGHNLVFDLRALSKHLGGATPRRVWCTLSNARILRPALNAYNLARVASSFGVEVPAWWLDVKSLRKSLDRLPRDLVERYVSQDVALTAQLYERQRQESAGSELIDWENRSVSVYAKLAARGMRFDADYARECVDRLYYDMAEHREYFSQKGIANLASAQQRAFYLFTVRGVPKPDPNRYPVCYTDRGGLSTSADSLAALQGLNPDLADELERMVQFLRGMRLAATLASFDDHAALDGRVHSLIATTARTGRRSSSHPNVQNLPLDGAEYNMRGVLVADPGYRFVELDYSNAEILMAAVLAGDDNLAKAASSADLHTEFAKTYFPEFRTAGPERRKELRQMGKAITFGTAYGMGPRTLSLRLGISEREARAILRNRDEAFPRVAFARAMAERGAESRGTVELWSGRPVFVAEEQGQLYRAWNSMVQGGVAEMVKRAVVAIDEFLSRSGAESYIANEVHDSILVAQKEGEDYAVEEAKRIMGGILPEPLLAKTRPRVKMVVSVKEGRWAR